MRRRAINDVERQAARAGVRIGGYMPPKFRAQTFAELEKWCAEYGAVAVCSARWSAASVWMMRSPECLSNPVAVVSLALVLCQDEDRARLGYPSLSGLPYDRAASFSEEAMAEARRVGAETLADWERAGQPGIISAVQRTQTYINAVFRQQHNQKENDAA